uniref:Uncharacterized protein n=1 Tax=Clytia hemisphaerica TaxID=252671 RepID=A0A7M5V6V3_9CNID
FPTESVTECILRCSQDSQLIGSLQSNFCYCLERQCIQNKTAGDVESSNEREKRMNIFEKFENAMEITSVKDKASWQFSIISSPNPTIAIPGGNRQLFLNRIKLTLILSIQFLTNDPSMKFFDFIFGARLRIKFQHEKLAVYYKGKSIISPRLPSSIPQNQWKHFAVTIRDVDGKITVQYYVDGTLLGQSQTSYNGLAVDFSGPVSFQCYNCQFTGLNLLKGLLTATEILDVEKDYNALEAFNAVRVVCWEDFKQTTNDKEVSIHQYPF